MAILLVEKSEGVHQFVDGSSVGSQAVGRLKIDFLAATQASDAAPAAGLAASYGNVILLGGSGLETNAGLGVIFLENR